MIYTGRVIDSASKPVAGARLVFSTAAGAVIPYQVLTDNTGRYAIDADADGGLLDPGNTVQFIAPGFFTYGLSANNLPSYFEVTLTKKTDKAQLVVIGSGVAGLLLLASGKKLNGISGKGDVPNWVMPTVAIGVGAYLVINFFTKDGKGSDSAQLQGAAAAKIAELRSQGIVPTISSAIAEGLSSKIVQAADNCGTDESAIYDAFSTLKNEADFWLLMQVYGVRQYKSCFDGNWLTDSSYNLPQTIASELSSWARSDLNDILASRNINYQF